MKNENGSNGASPDVVQTTQTTFGEAIELPTEDTQFEMAEDIPGDIAEQLRAKLAEFEAKEKERKAILALPTIDNFRMAVSPEKVEKALEGKGLAAYCIILVRGDGSVRTAAIIKDENYERDANALVAALEYKKFGILHN